MTAQILTSFDGDATFSECGRYRYTLGRRLTASDSPRRCLFIMLNPSTATAVEDDPTIRRCRSFAASWGYDRLDIANLFALRSTDPKALYPSPTIATGDPANHNVMLALASQAALVVCAWGVHGALIQRGERVRQLLVNAGREPRHLGLTKDGHPRHPLYMKGDTMPMVWT